MRNYYMPSTMHAELLITYQQSSDALSYLLKGDKHIRDLSSKPLHEIMEKSFIASITEHEYFHHRHCCSSTYGFFLFSICSLSMSYRLQAAMAFEGPQKQNTLIDFSQLKPDNLSDPFTYAMVRVGITDFILELFDGLKLKSIESLTNAEKEAMDMIGVNLPQAAPTDNELRTLSNSPTSVELMETIAIWKQYAWLSRILYFGKSPHAPTLENTWLHWVEECNPQYMATANYIMKRAGITLHHILMGIIIDLSLNPPFFSKGTFGWSEICPRLRLEAILNICNKLPSNILNKDCLELITPEEYQNIIDEIENRLGWRKQSLIIKDTLNHISRILKKLMPHNKFPQKGEEEQYADFFRSRLVNAYMSQFFNGFVNKVNSPGYMLFPYHHRDPITVGYIIRPIVTQYSDQLRMNTLRLREGETNLFISDPLTASIVLQDMAENIWLNETINSNLQQINKPFARKFYRGIPNALKAHFNHSKSFKEVVKTILKKWPSFEEFISDRIGKDYHTYFVFR